MNPLTYTEIPVYSLWMYSIVFWYKWILSLIPKYLPVPILIRSIVFWYKWILSLIPKYLYFFWFGYVSLYFDINESSHLYRNIYILFGYVLLYFHLNETSHLYRNTYLFWYWHIFVFWYKWILSLILKYPHPLFWIPSIVFRYKWILSLIPKCLHILLDTYYYNSK
jgi:hypothetical protein